MAEKKKKVSNPYKVKDLKVYGSNEWLANSKKKYRQVFDRKEVSFIYVELSFHNKLFDESDWTVHVNLKAYSLNDGKRKELCNLEVDKVVTKDLSTCYIHQAWGNKKPGFYWKPGLYEWEAYINGDKVKTQQFYIENVGLVTEDNNPYFSVKSLKLYEGPNTNTPKDERTYFKSFDASETRYIFVEFSFQNLVRELPWRCELCFKFYNDAHQLKGETVELLTVNPNDEEFTVTSGWGSNDYGSWFSDKYTMEVVFMDNLVSVLPFEVGDSFERGVNEALLPGTGHSILPPAAEDDQTFEDVMLELEELIGLHSIKKRVKEYAEYLKFLKIRVEKGYEEPKNINLHTVFAGNPGTGKTTVAKMLGKIYKHMGLVSKGHVHEVDRAELVGEYIGQTAPKVKEAIKQARGGILFIDEAYSLARAKDDSKDFGREVIEILIKEMSDGKGDLAVIVAGYPQEMRTFMDTNPGLKSRFTQWFDFPDYMPQELIEIADFFTKKQNIFLSTQGKAFLYEKIVEAYRSRDRYFGNARHVNNLIDKAKINLGLRVMKKENPRGLSKEELSTITVPDLERIFIDEDKTIPDIPIDEGMLEASLAELNELIGLKAVKKEINELVRLVRFYREMGREVLGQFSLHSVFIGNPGTGKTTVARILAKIFKALGILERGHLVECDRQSLVAGYVGQTAIKTSEKIDQALGGVLFIDEAYGLVNNKQNDFGGEAIETLIKRMEDQKGQFAIIAAGYPKYMNEFLEANPGLKSRFDRQLMFEDFELHELMKIVDARLKKSNLVMVEDARISMKKFFEEVKLRSKKMYFGNGRVAVKATDQVIRNQNLRMADIPLQQRTKDMLRKVTKQDVLQLRESFKEGKGGEIGFKVSKVEKDKPKKSRGNLGLGEPQGA